MLLQDTANLYNNMLALIDLLIIIVILYSFSCIRGDPLLDGLVRSKLAFVWKCCSLAFNPGQAE